MFGFLCFLFFIYIIYRLLRNITFTVGRPEPPHNEAPRRKPETKAPRKDIYRDGDAEYVDFEEVEDNSKNQ